MYGCETMKEYGDRTLIMVHSQTRCMKIFRVVRDIAINNVTSFAAG
jgi:hypothetical protein